MSIYTKVINHFKIIFRTQTIHIDWD